MHAFAGFVARSSLPALAQPPQRMVDRLRHHPSQIAGYARFPGIGLWFGWVSARQPAFAPDLAWSASRLIAVALAAPVAPSVAETLAERWEEQGAAALRTLDGSFSGLVVDLRTSSATLFNDRFGLGRVYVHHDAHGFYFGSEAKSLLAVLPQLRRFDPRGLAELFSVGCVLQNRSLFAGVELLPPGAAWTISSDGALAKARYFDPAEWESLPVLSSADYVERLREVFARAAQRSTGAGSAVALSLTGGLDSRAVIAWTRAEPGSLPCYTFGGPVRDCADVLIARHLAALCRHPHTTIRIDREFFGSFAGLAEKCVYLSDGAMDVSGAVELHVNQKARAIAPVRVTGNYGSEILRSHVAFRPGALDHSLFTPEFSQLVADAAETYRREAAVHPLSFIAFKQVPWHHYARFSVERSQLTPRSPFLDHELVALAYQAPSELRASPRPLLHLIAAGNPRLAAVATDRALRNRSLPFVSTAARAFQEFTAKAEYAFDYGMPPWLARADRVLSPLHLERLFLGRHKFYHFRTWYRDQLRDVVEQHGRTATPSLCYRDDVARQLASDHASGRRNRTLELHRLLTLQLVERTLLHA